MTLDPRIGFYFSILIAITTALTAFGAEYTNLFGDVTSGKILSVLAIVNAVAASVNAILHSIPSAGVAVSEERKFLLGPKE